ELLRVFGEPRNSRIADTRFLGDLYQDLSEAARKRFALLQTPDFVEEFILDRTLEPAIETFGLEEVRMLDPTCGSGHFLLGGFARLLEHRQQAHPGESGRARVQKALDGVYGVDLNPFAVAIARFRLLVAALNAGGTRRLKDAPNYEVHVAAGDSLLHGFRGGDQQLLSTEREWVPDSYASGDYEEANEILSRHYHAVVGNPPYIADKDRAHKEAVRQRYSSCHGKYVLAVPFKEMFFDIGVQGSRPGYVGMITANNFMKREFGSKVIEEFIPTIDLTHVIDTSGAYIPGHGTPTVILFGRSREPLATVVKAALGIRGEPSTPNDPGQGKVWRSIVDNIDQDEAENDFITITNIEREKLHKHPWSLAGGGAGDLKDLIERSTTNTLGELAESIGITAVTGEDDVFVFDSPAQAERLGIERCRTLQTGDTVRDWSNGTELTSIWPYDDELKLIDIDKLPQANQILWKMRTNLSKRKRFGVPMLEKGATWYEWQELYGQKLKTPLSITFAFVATHNHFVLDRGGKVFNRSAPVIKLPAEATEDDHLALLGVLNSSVACFWFKSTGHNKGSTVDKHGARQRTIPFEDFWEISGSQAGRFPMIDVSDDTLNLATRLDSLVTEAQTLRPKSQECLEKSNLEQCESKFAPLFFQQVFLQEELDWRMYAEYKVLDESYTEVAENVLVRPGERAFEIVLARKVRSGEAENDWFRRHSIEPVYEVPSHWPDSYRKVVQQRIEAIESVRFIKLLEVPEYKRRWNLTPWDVELAEALQTWLLTRIESHFSTQHTPTIITTARLADAMARDPDFLQVAQLYTGRDDFDLTKLVTGLCMKEDVPYLSSLRYKATGLRKRAQWEKTWELQRREDAGEEIGKIPVPPKYGS
ncbi:MAG: BREX-2 system adenine-specific DNA-methyltransferase PglX, partial [Vulcanimicrobiota bacterium]